MPDDDILVRMHNIIREHLPCEVWMLNFCHQALCTRGVLGQLPVNVLIASFSIYARDLIDLSMRIDRSARVIAPQITTSRDGCLSRIRGTSEPSRSMGS